MKKLIMIALMVAGAISADAQNDSRYERHERWDNNGRYDHSRDRRFNSRWGYSQRHSNPIDDMQNDIRREIEWGSRKGSLTNNEARRLARELDRIEYREDRYFRDGYLSQWEFENLARDLYALDREVSRQRRDWDRRW
jgi:hypothetical protein